VCAGSDRRVGQGPSSPSWGEPTPRPHDRRLRKFGGRPLGLDADGGQLQVDVARRLSGIDGRDATEPLGETVIERLEFKHGDRTVNEHDVMDVV
jgi:hypothetical protein